jgi:hypothetical protein
MAKIPRNMTDKEKIRNKLDAGNDSASFHASSENDTGTAKGRLLWISG